jgi:8-oxo-dGTP pyrophosphatase MutT (NUDIX family)
MFTAKKEISRSQKIITQSAGGVVYYIASDKEPRYLLIKRQALSKKIERVCPKWKIHDAETPEEAALREVSEETGLLLNHLQVVEKLGMTQIRTDDPAIGNLNKDITFFLMTYDGDPTNVHLIDGEGYVWVYKRCTLQEVLALVYYADMRELIRQSYGVIKADVKQDTIKQKFLDLL